MIPPLAALLRLHEINIESRRNGGEFDRREVSRLLQAITPAMYDHYKRLYTKFGRDAVAPITRGGACAGCHTVQPARLEVADEHIYLCDNCGRLIYQPHVAYDMYVG